MQTVFVDSLSKIITRYTFYSSRTSRTSMREKKGSWFYSFIVAWNTGVSDWTSNSIQSVMLSLVLAFSLIIFSVNDSRIIHTLFLSRYIYMYVLRQLYGNLIFFFFLNDELFLGKGLGNNQVSHLLGCNFINETN